MKLPITDEFLWDLYELYESSSNLLEDFENLSNVSASYVPELAKAKQIYGNKKAQTRFSQFIYYLKKQGYIEVKELQEKNAVILTKEGLDKALKAKLDNDSYKKRKDGKMVMVLYDIPEKKKSERNIFRDHLKNLGFELLQRSVWVSPFDVLEETREIAIEYSLESYLNIFLIEKINLEDKSEK